MAIGQDPLLRHVKLIAEPWDASVDGYRVGEFPPPWIEWNDQFRDEIRDFWNGRSAGIRSVATRLAGSSDLYADDGRSPYASVNFVTAHDGFTVRDLVSYDHKHNLANGENNQDGTNNNRSSNHGVEGETTDKKIVALRRRQVANLMATLCLSNGVPMITAGDERGRTQRGNNNAYCQDNELSWIDWRADDAWLDVYEVTQAALRLRREHPALRQRHFFEGRPTIRGGPKDLAWLHPSGREMTGDDWYDPTLTVLGMFVSGAPLRSPGPHGEQQVDKSFAMFFNSGDRSVPVELPRTTGSIPARSPCPPTPSSRLVRRSRPVTGCGWVAAAWWSCGRPEPLCRAAAQPTGIGAPTGGSGSTTRFRSASVRAPERSAPMPAATTRPTPATAIGIGTWCSATKPIPRAKAGSSAIRVPNAPASRRRRASSSRMNGTTGSKIASPTPMSSSSGVSRPTTCQPTAADATRAATAWRSPAHRSR